MRRRYAIPTTSLALVTACAQPGLVGVWSVDDLEIDGEGIALHSDDGSRDVEVTIDVDVQLEVEFTYAVRQALPGEDDEPTVYLASYGWSGEAEEEGGLQYQLELDSLDGVPGLDLECQITGDLMECEGELGQQDWELLLVREAPAHATP
jgi:hypothetical protein